MGTEYAPFVRGAAMCTAADGGSNLCFGSSSGTLYVIEVRRCSADAADVHDRGGKVQR